MLQRCRISGFALEYTKEVLAAAFADGDRPLELIVPTDSAWPLVPLPDVPEPFYVSNLPRILGASSSDIRLHRSQSFAEEFVNELENRYSVLSNLTTTSLQDRSLEEDYTLTNDDFQSSSGDLPESDGQLTPRFRHMGTYEILCTRTFEVSEGTRTPSPEMFSTPKSADALNKLNERDPAFHRTWNAIKTQMQLEANEQDQAYVRTVQAMRSNSQTDTPAITNENRPLTFASSSTITTIESPAESCETSLSSRANETGGSSRRRYFAFVDRLRSRGSI